MIAIIDYGAGNIRSVQKAVAHLGQKAVITSDHKEILQADKVILPGVGAFGSLMEILKKGRLHEIIKQTVDGGKPFLGICLGLQALFESSEESVDVQGLNILKGRIVKIPQGEGLKIPHIGWNSLNILKSDVLFKGIPQGEYFYFVHSYYLKTEDTDIVSAETTYGENLQVAVEQGNIHAVQFHPEKSGEAGLMVLNNFLSL
ncbi:MAG: imidazole glycerol phosphate synthase, glutamine amidotransferase subunit [Clostridiales bacterium 43-6]|nr:MAG: imidazole glycerol phosphate synthase, glutamine amidotransferase subunit [Clostridiales bacterium 43-6]